MYPFKRVMIGLDFTLMDRGLIQFTSSLTELVEVEELYFINIQPQLELPPEIAEEFPMLSQEPADQLRQNMLQEIKEHFPQYERWQDRIHALVIEGSARKEFLKQAEDLDTSISSSWAEKRRNGTGIVPTQVVSKAGCSVLFLPEIPPSVVDHIVVGCDFSEPAKLALEGPCRCVAMPHEVDIDLINAYYVPMGYYKTGRTEAQFAALMRKNTEKRLQKFVQEHELDLTGVANHFIYGKKKSPATVLMKQANKREAKLIMVSARGLGGLSALLLGSTTENLKLVDDRAILVVKDKNSTYGLRDLIEQI